jgi:hypothetical protein
LIQLQYQLFEYPQKDNLRYRPKSGAHSAKHPFDHGITGQRTRGTMALTLNKLEKVVELEEQLRSQYQGQLDEKAASIEALTKKQDELQATIDSHQATRPPSTSSWRPSPTSPVNPPPISGLSS